MYSQPLALSHRLPILREQDRRGLSRFRTRVKGCFQDGTVDEDHPAGLVGGPQWNTSAEAGKGRRKGNVLCLHASLVSSSVLLDESHLANLLMCTAWTDMEVFVRFPTPTQSTNRPLNDIVSLYIVSILNPPVKPIPQHYHQTPLPPLLSQESTPPTTLQYPSPQNQTPNPKPQTQKRRVSLKN
jgi:hypothetical protein